jgi:hypothetical protein
MGSRFSHGKDTANCGRLDVLRGRVAARPKATSADRDIIATAERGGDEQSDRAERKILMDI